jgi:putative transposase
MPDHVHVLVGGRPEGSPSLVANQFRGFASRRLRGAFPRLRSRLPALWSRLFLAASAGAVSATAVQRHVGAQCEYPWRKERAA